MENGSEKWNFQGNERLNASSFSVRAAYNMLMEIIRNNNNDNNNGDKDKKRVVPLCRVDPTENPLFRTTPEATEAVATAVHSYNFNSYAPTVGLPEAKRLVCSLSRLIYYI